MPCAPIPVIYEDDWLLAVDKPAGLLTVPTPRKEKRTLTSLLNDRARENGLGFRLHPCHRLDRETSGIILYAKGKSAQKKMMDLFRQRRVKKTYLAFVQGALPSQRGEIARPIEGSSALTRYIVVEERKDFSIIEVRPESGRTNQIRIHFKMLGHPLVGETRYAFRRDFKLRHPRVCLHASSLEFRHPVTGLWLALKSELARDLKDFLLRHG